MKGILDTNPAIPAVFRPLEMNEKIQVHDYSYNTANQTFDYVDEVYIGQTFVAHAADSTVFFVRPVITPLNILDLLQNRRCVCLNPKESGRSYCAGCYFALPDAMKKRLYKRFRDGYEQAFLASLIYLIGYDRTDVDRIIAAVPKPKDGQP